MNSTHTTPCRAAALVAAVWFACAAGCRNQSTGLPNPFLAPDRVPPPATRTILPGQAQPYYPGDPLPVMQSSTTPSAAPAGMNGQLFATAQETGNDGLSWNAPGVGNAGPTTASALPGNTPPPRSFGSSNEPAVSIPADGNSLRFPIPSPEAVATAPAAAAPAAAASAQQPIQLTGVPSVQPAVLPAAFTSPIPSDEGSANVTQLGGITTSSNGPWRSPQITPAVSATPFGTAALAPTAAATPSVSSNMDVRLRAVPSPPPQPVDPTTPRIRLPSYVAPQPVPGASTLSQPTASYAAVVPMGLLQTVQISPLPAPPITAAASSPSANIAIASGDGFRPRTSMR